MQLQALTHPLIEEKKRKTSESWKEEPDKKKLPEAANAQFEEGGEELQMKGRLFEEWTMLTPYVLLAGSATLEP